MVLVVTNHGLEGGALYLNRIGNLIFRPPLGGMGQVMCYGNRFVNRVALTFDDGPLDPGTIDILAVLEQYKVKATFFVVGENVRSAPDIVRIAYEGGHIIGNHSMWHRRWSSLSLRDSGHILEAERCISEVIGHRPCLYRTPWGWVTPWEFRRLRKAGYQVIGWDIDSYDWVQRVDPGQVIAHRIMRQVRYGSVVLFHDGWGLLKNGRRPETSRALRELIPYLREKGIELVTLPELLGVAAYQ